MKTTWLKMVPLLVVVGASLSGRQAEAQVLNAKGTESLNLGLYTYAYTFSVSGDATSPTPALTDIFLSSDDLSPLNLTITKNNAPTTAWSFLGNNAPYNYLDFTSLDPLTGNPLDTLGAGDELEVTFTDSSGLFLPDTTHFAAGFDSSISGFTANVTPLVGPTVNPNPSALTPEPGTLSLVCAMLVVGGGWLNRRGRRATSR